jgi:hypothetical protein
LHVSGVFDKRQGPSMDFAWGACELERFVVVQEEIEACEELLKQRTRSFGSKIKDLLICPIYANLPTDLQVPPPTPPCFQRVMPCPACMLPPCIQRVMPCPACMYLELNDSEREREKECKPYI